MKLFALLGLAVMGCNSAPKPPTELLFIPRDAEKPDWTYVHTHECKRVSKRPAEDWKDSYGNPHHNLALESWECKNGESRHIFGEEK